jgi:hypothetical protein
MKRDLSEYDDDEGVEEFRLTQRDLEELGESNSAVKRASIPCVED